MRKLQTIQKSKEKKKTMKLTYKLCLIMLFLNTHLFHAMDLAKGTLIEKCQEDAEKLKDAYLKGTSSAFYKPALENTRTKKSSKKVKDIITGHDVDTSVVLLAESKLLWIRDKDRVDLLHKAASAGYIAFCQFLLDVKALPVDALNGASRTPAQEAILFGNIKKIPDLKKVLTLLRQRGAQVELDVPYKNKLHGKTILDKIVLRTDHNSIDERLYLAFGFGARLETQDTLGKTIMHRLAQYTADLCSTYRYYDESNLMRPIHGQQEPNREAAITLPIMLSRYQRYPELQRGLTLLAIQRFRKDSPLGKIPKDMLVTLILPRVLHGTFKNTQAYAHEQLELVRSLLSIQDNKHQTAFSLAVLIAEESEPTSLETCRILLRKGASPFCAHEQDKNALYLAAIYKKSFPLTRALLTTCPSIKPALKLVWLAYKRLNMILPKDVLRSCIAPYVIFNATEAQLETINSLARKKCVLRPRYDHGLAKKQSLVDSAETPEIKALLDPEKIEQHRVTILQELYASIGITIAEEKKEPESVL